jgi:YNFM family putative membrane transporter
MPTLLAATSTSLAQLIFWRFLQGITVPGIIAVLITYIGEEWPPDKVALIMSFYVSGTALGGFWGASQAGMLADRFSWRVSFLVLGAASLAGAAGVAAWLPNGRRRRIINRRIKANARGFSPPSARALSQPPPGRHLCRRLQRALFAGGRLHLDHISPHAARLHAVDHALSSLFFVYLIGLVVTPAAGYLITRVGLRAGSAEPSSAP